MSEPTAYFVKLPFRLEDLSRPHYLSDRKPYIVEKTIVLAAIDYGNFVTDLCVDRWRYDKAAGRRRLCKTDTVCTYSNSKGGR